MDKLLVETKELKLEYRRRNRLWEKFYKRFCLWYIRIWRKQPLIHYPLTIDIELGTMKYYYFRFGFSAVLNRIENYNLVLGNRMEGEDVDVDPEDFYIQTLLTDTEEIENQLNKELSNLCSN